MQIEVVTWIETCIIDAPTLPPEAVCIDGLDLYECRHPILPVMVMFDWYPHEVGFYWIRTVAQGLAPPW